jgi:putative ABC transport system permease protein
MRFLLRTLSFRHIALNPLRTALTMLGIMLGVAMGVGVGLLNESTLASFDEMVSGLASGSDLTVTVSGRAGMPEETLDTILEDPGVKAAAPSIRLSGFLVDHPLETILLLGVDALADEGFRTLRVGGDPNFDPLVFLNTPDSVLVPRSLALRNNLAEGDTLRVSTRGREYALTVRAIVDEEGAAKVYSGNVLILDVYAAQEKLEKTGSFDQIDVIAAPGINPDDLARSLRAALGESYLVERPGRNQQAEKMVEGLRQTTDMLGMLALFVGMFLIYNTFNTAVAQRRREIGILRSLGSERRHIILLFLGEAAVIGLIGSVLGVLGGVGLARVLIEQYAATISNFYFQVHPEVVQFSWPLMSRFVALGTISAVVSAVFPARRAARISPLEALSGVALETERQKGFRLAFGLGLLALGIEVVILMSTWESTRVEIGVISALVSFIALALLSPMLITWSIALLRPIGRRFFGLEARIGGDNLLRSPGRTSVTVAALMIGITLAVAMGGSFASLAASLDEWITEGITADLTVRGSVALPGVNSVELPAELLEELAAVPGVADVGSFRIAPLPFREGVIHVMGVDLDSYWRHSESRWVSGNRNRDRPKLQDGTHVLVSENLSTKYNLHPGDPFEVVGPKGRRTYTVAGVHVDYTSDLGAALLDRAAYIELFGDTHLDSISLWMKPGVDPVALRETIRQSFPDRQLFIQTNVEFRGEIEQAVAQIFGMVDVMQLLVIVIAVIGILNTLLVSIIDRTRELGVLRAVGFTKEQLRRVIVWEAGLMGLIAGTLGALSGSIFSMSIVHLINRQLVGWSTAFVFPIDSVIKGFWVAVLSSLLASWWPSRKAASLNIVAAMEYE